MSQSTYLGAIFNALSFKQIDKNFKFLEQLLHNVNYIVKSTCIMRKCGLLMLSWTDLNKSCTRVLLALHPLIRYLFLPPRTIFKFDRKKQVLIKKALCNEVKKIQ